ncbi:hypothetical protein CDAR_392521 [Caerostris darwini]|uniref:Uncharacterized protein n=1 Tax=Caerostris darwini TaxID=1538125 RepID=A0AAV4NZ27_9ARAC|nr:hypothetical protein CDAR_392521 [Caerostris darwini]
MLSLAAGQKWRPRDILLMCQKNHLWLERLLTHSKDSAHTETNRFIIGARVQLAWIVLTTSTYQSTWRVVSIGIYEGTRRVLSIGTYQGNWLVLSTSTYQGHFFGTPNTPFMNSTVAAWRPPPAWREKIYSLPSSCGVPRNVPIPFSGQAAVSTEAGYHGDDLERGRTRPAAPPLGRKSKQFFFY